MPTHVEEQENLRRETIQAFHNAVGDDSDDDDLLIPREKTKDELEAEEEEYKAYLERQVGEDLKSIIQVDSKGDEEDVRSNADDDEGGKQDGDDKKKKKKRKKSKLSEEVPKKTKAEQDQEFLMKCVYPLYILVTLFLILS